jgi:recombinational DNA repair ATPase RecF
VPNERQLLVHAVIAELDLRRRARLRSAARAAAQVLLVVAALVTILVGLRALEVL